MRMSLHISELAIKNKLSVTFSDFVTQILKICKELS